MGFRAAVPCARDWGATEEVEEGDAAEGKSEVRDRDVDYCAEARLGGEVEVEYYHGGLCGVEAEGADGDGDVVELVRE